MASPYRLFSRIHKTLCSPSALSKPTRGSAPKREVWCSPEHAMGMSVGCMQPSRAAAASHANNWRQMRPMLLHGHQRPDAGLLDARTQHCLPLHPRADTRAIRLVTMSWCSAGAHDTASASKALADLPARNRQQNATIPHATGYRFAYQARHPPPVFYNTVLYYPLYIPTGQGQFGRPPPRSTQTGQPPLRAFSTRSGKCRGRRWYVRWKCAVEGLVRVRRASDLIDHSYRSQVLECPQCAARMQRIALGQVFSKLMLARVGRMRILFLVA